MKRTPSTLITLLAVVLLAVACKSHDEEVKPSTNDDTKLISFCVVNYKQYPLDDVTDGSAAQSRMTRATEATVLEHLSMTVFDTENKICKQIKQNKGDNGYGTFSVALPHGTYNIVFFGYNGTREVEIVSPTDIHFADGYVANCFCKALPLTVDSNTPATQGIVLERPIASFAIDLAVETIPAQAKYMTYTIEDAGTVLNALTGFSSKNETRQGSLSFTSAEKYLRMSIYTFLPETEHKATFIMTATDANGGVIKTRTFKNVPLKINQKTIYDGNFFSDDDDPNEASDINFSLTLGNSEWDEVSYPY